MFTIHRSEQVLLRVNFTSEELHSVFAGRIPAFVPCGASLSLHVKWYYGETTVEHIEVLEPLMDDELAQPTATKLDIGQKIEFTCFFFLQDAVGMAIQELLDKKKYGIRV